MFLLTNNSNHFLAKKRGQLITQVGAYSMIISVNGQHGCLDNTAVTVGGMSSDLMTLSTAIAERH